jgi:hypothetical protein
MRQLKSDYGSVIKVVEHIILRNGWEYYVTDEPIEDGIAFALVYGDDTELGCVSLDEIKPYIVSRTKDLADLMPAPSWKWVS